MQNRKLITVNLYFIHVCAYYAAIKSRHRKDVLQLTRINVDVAKCTYIQFNNVYILLHWAI